jgi:hypothetical protein
MHVFCSLHCRNLRGPLRRDVVDNDVKTDTGLRETASESVSTIAQPVTSESRPSESIILPKDGLSAKTLISRRLQGRRRPGTRRRCGSLRRSAPHPSPSQLPHARPSLLPSTLCQAPPSSPPPETPPPPPLSPLPTASPEIQIPFWARRRPPAAAGCTARAASPKKKVGHESSAAKEMEEVSQA